MTHKSSQIRPERIAGAICDLQSVLRLCRAGGSAISLGKGCHGNDLWMLLFRSLQPSHILRQNYPGFLYVRPVFFCSISSFCSAVPAPSVPSPHTHTHRHLQAVAFGYLHECWQIHVYASPQRHRTTPPALQIHIWYTHVTLCTLIKPGCSAKKPFFIQLVKSGECSMFL